MLGVAYGECMIVEDADAGIEAGRNAGMTTLAVNKARGGHIKVDNLGVASILEIIG
jgi:beta-phosphoglucomutase-like phosphatase (HAD superfamily)